MNISRRSFLRSMALGTAVSLTAPRLLWASPSPVTETRLMMGTFVTIKLYSDSKDQGIEALNAAFEEMSALEKLLTRHSSSPLSTLNAQGSLTDAPKPLLHVAQYAQKMNSLSTGVFDATVLPLLAYFESRQNPTGTMTLDPKEIAERKQLISAKSVRIQENSLSFDRSGMQMTLDGVAKGYIADMGSAVLLKHGIMHHIVNAGGDIVAHGSKGLNPWTVAVEDPDKQGKYPASLALNNQAIATSGSYEHYFDSSRNYHHLINPQLAQSPAGRSVSVIAPTAMEADALATGLSFLPPRQAVALIDALPGRACFILDQHNNAVSSANWNA